MSQNTSDIFAQYQSQLRGFIAKRVPSKEDCEDILQNVFYQLAKVDLEKNPIQQISAWLYTVARNQITDRSRKQRESSMPYLNNGDEDGSFVKEVTEILFDDDASPEMVYLRALFWEELEKALSELPEEQRNVFELTELEGISFKEISESTNIPVNTLISRKRYAVLHLRKRLSNLYDELLLDD